MADAPVTDSPVVHDDLSTHHDEPPLSPADKLVQAQAHIVASGEHSAKAAELIGQHPDFPAAEEGHAPDDSGAGDSHDGGDDGKSSSDSDSSRSGDRTYPAYSSPLAGVSATTRAMPRPGTLNARTHAQATGRGIR